MIEVVTEVKLDRLDLLLVVKLIIIILIINFVRQLFNYMKKIKSRSD